MKTFLIFCFGMVVSGLLAASAQADEHSLLTVDHHSEFTAENKTRNPFWPIGWVPARGGPHLPKMHEAEISPEDFVVSSISIGTQISAAVINGKIYDEGEFVPLETEKQKIYVQVVRVTDQGVVLQYQNKRVTVQMGAKPAEPKKH